jgi:hypothetical protein
VAELNVTKPTCEVMAKHDRQIDRCRLIQQAAIRLYGALVTACLLHPEHSAYFRLDVCDVNDSHFVRFDVALKHILEKEVVDEDPIWFAIESIFDDCMQGVEPAMRTGALEGAWSDFTSTRKRLNPSPPPENCSGERSKRKKVVRFLDPAKLHVWSTDIISSGDKVSQLPEQIEQKKLPNLSKDHDFCRQVRRCCMQKNALGGCLGYLERDELSSHRVLFSPKSVPSKKSTSLAHIMSRWPSQGYGHGILIYEGLRLARQLASAVLQFHTTPLLKEDWASSDVVFFGMDDTPSLSVHGMLTAPHLGVRIKSPATSAVEMPASRTTAESRQMIKNRYTFALGLILIELAYQAPLRCIRGVTESRDIDSLEYSFLLAEKISADMVTQLGLPYKKMVQKCINCDFGEGFDLTKPSLQVAFYKDIICGLEGLENHFKELHIDE